MASSWRCMRSSVSSADKQVALSSIMQLCRDESSEQAMPMFTAVSCLSPVSTHTPMPAAFSEAMVSGTPSWRRSSMPDEPTSVRSRSSSSMRRSMRLRSPRSRFFTSALERSALRYFVFQR